MKERLARKLTVVAVLAGLIIHIGLGYRAGLVVAAIALAAHLLVGVVARRALRGGPVRTRRTETG